jgi:hypothetical protein
MLTCMEGARNDQAPYSSHEHAGSQAAALDEHTGERTDRQHLFDLEATVDCGGGGGSGGGGARSTSRKVIMPR